MTTKLNWIEDLNKKMYDAKLVYQVREVYEEVGIMHKTEYDKEACRKHLHLALQELVKAYDKCGGGVGSLLPSTIRDSIVDIMRLDMGWFQ